MWTHVFIKWHVFTVFLKTAIKYYMLAKTRVFPVNLLNKITYNYDMLPGIMLAFSFFYLE